MFTWMAIDRTNVSGVLTSTFLQDTSMTHDQANTGVSLLWLGIVLLEIPSNVSFAPASLLPGPNSYFMADRAPSHRPTLLDPRPSHYLGLCRGTAVTGHQCRWVVCCPAIPRARRERVHPWGAVHAVEMVCTRRADEAYGGVLPWTVRLCGVWVADFSGCTDFTWEGRPYGLAMVSSFFLYWLRIGARIRLTEPSTRIFVICGVSTICERSPRPEACYTTDRHDNYSRGRPGSRFSTQVSLPHRKRVWRFDPCTRLAQRA